MIEKAFINGFEMEYARFGTGKKTLVVIPGLAIKSVMLSASIVEAAYKDLTEEYTVYLFDVRKNIPEDYTILQFADDTAAVMESLGIKGAALFGASMGGMVSQALTVRHPELIACLVLGSSQCRKNPKTPKALEGWRELALAHKTTELVADMLDKVYSPDTLKLYREAWLAAFAEISEEELRRFTVLTHAILGFSFYEELKNVKCPVLSIGSEGDLVFGPDSARELAAVTKGELYVYPANYGHAVYDEAPDYLKRLKAFTDKNLK